MQALPLSDSLPAASKHAFKVAFAAKASVDAEIEVNGADAVDPEKAVRDAAGDWFAHKGKDALGFGGNPFGGLNWTKSDGDPKSLKIVLQAASDPPTCSRRYAGPSYALPQWRRWSSTCPRSRTYRRCRCSRPGQQIETWQGRSRRAFTPAVIIFIALPETKDNIDPVIPLELLPRQCPIAGQRSRQVRGRGTRFCFEPCPDPQSNNGN